MRRILYLIGSGAVLAVAAILAFVLIAADRPSGVVPAVEAMSGDLTREQLQDRPGLPVYWLGPSYKGLSIVKIQYVTDPGSPDFFRHPEQSVTVIYASCVPGPAPTEGPVEAVPVPGGLVRHCSPGEYAVNVQVVSEWFCLKPSSLLAQGAREGPPLEIRGAIVQATTSNSIMAHFGRSTVSIFGESEEDAIEAFGYLQGVNPPGLAVASEVGGRLEPPIPEDECEGFILPTPEPTASLAAE